MSLRSRIPPLLLLLAMASPAAAQQGGARPATPDPARPLNLSLPRDAVWAGTARPAPTEAERLRGDAAGLPDPGGRTGAAQGQRGRMPYGTGFEARQHEGGGGRGGGGGGGRGAWRGR